MELSRDQKTPVLASSYFAHIVVPQDPAILSFTKQDGTADAGEIAGTIVLSKLRGPIFNALGDRLGEYTGSDLSSSIVFSAGVMDPDEEVAFNYNGTENQRITDTIAALSKVGVPNGSWACDYLTGLLIIKKLTAGTTQTITTWKVQIEDPDGSGGSSGGSEVLVSNKTASLNDLARTIAVAGTTFTSVLDLTSLGAKQVEVTLNVTALTGADTLLDVIPQYSYDNVTWFDQDTDGQFDQVSIVTTLPDSQTLLLGIVAKYLRFKYVVAGATPSVTFGLYSVAKP